MTPKGPLPKIYSQAPITTSDPPLRGIIALWVALDELEDVAVHYEGEDA
jgi:hypothetical protein